MKFTTFPFIIILLLCLAIPLYSPAQTGKHRLLVLSDIEADPDDAQSLIRLLTYANEIDIEGLIATTSTFQRLRVAPETMHKIIDAYAKVHPNLIKHDKAYPTPQTLQALVKKGEAVYGMLGVGEGHDSEGSEWLIKALEKPDNRPLWVSVWGGPNCLAQALWKIQKTKTAEQAEKLYSKLRVYTISDQDDSGPWIRKTFPAIFYVASAGGAFGGATWSAFTRGTPGVPGYETDTNEWLSKHIQQGHGPLGALYPDVAYGLEGDTPSYLGLIPNGLNDMEHPNYGGWGGRYELYNPADSTNRPVTASVAPPGNRGRVGIGGVMGTDARTRALQAPESRPFWTNADDSYKPVYYNGKWGRPIRIDSTTYKNNQVTIWRWKEDYQNDFAARMDWTIKDYKDANHPPVPKLNHPASFTVKSGEEFKLDADGTTDPDGDSMSYYWFQYPEAGTYDKIVIFGPSPTLYNVHHVTAPDVTSPQTVHFILKVTDKGTPALTRYKRVIVTIVPKGS